MGRASGRRPPRAGGTGDPGPGSPAGKEIGESLRQDPGGSWINSETGNIVNHETPRQQVPAGEPDVLFRGWMAHGVPPEADTTEERATAMRGGPNLARTRPAQLAPPAERPIAVPVYLVKPGGGSDVYLSANPRHLTVANNASDPTWVCARNPRRNRIGLLNEDPTTDIRFGLKPADLTGGGGAILLHGVVTYQWFETQDAIFACTTSATLTVVLSVIEEFEQVL